MTGPEPPERDRGAGGNERDDTEAAFAEIVAGWDAEPSGPRLAEPDEEPVPVPEDEHYVPPDPPPIPVLAPRTFCGVLIIVGGIVIMVFPGLLSLSGSGPVLLGLLAMAGGIGWLLMGLRGDADEDDSDDGARL